MTAQQIADLLGREGLAVDAELSAKLARYLELLMRWNARTNLTSVRGEAEIVLRHFGESLHCAQLLPPEVMSLLDYGSGAGFPGMVCSLVRPESEMLLAESQGKKAAFLQEACRYIPAQAKVHAGRVEALPRARRFDGVVMRAVDDMDASVLQAVTRVRGQGWLILMTTRQNLERIAGQRLPFEWMDAVPLVGTKQGIIARGRRLERNDCST